MQYRRRANRHLRVDYHRLTHCMPLFASDEIEFRPILISEKKVNGETVTPQYFQPKFYHPKSIGLLLVAKIR